MLKPEFNQPDLLRFELDGVMTYTNPFEQVPLYLDEKLHGCMEERRTTQVTWSCMLYGTPEEVKPMLPYAILLGSQLPEFVHDSLRHASWNFANVLFVAEGCVGELDVKALAHFWSIREVRVPKISKVATGGALPHKQPHGVQTADAF